MSVAEIPVEIKVVDIADILIDTNTTPEENMITSVRNIGLLNEPLLLDNGDGSYRCIVGRRRIDAVSKNGATTIRAKILRRDTTEADIARLILIENYQRSHNPVAEGRAIQVLVEQSGAPIKSIAKMLGVNPQKVYQRLAILDLPPIIVEGIESGAISFSAARLMLSLPEASIEKLMRQFDTTGRLTISDIADEKQRLAGRRDKVQKIYTSAQTLTTREIERLIARLKVLLNERSQGEN